MSFFEVKDLSAGYGRNRILENVTFDIPKNCICGVLGSNGSGKTTLIKAICGIIPHKGDVVLDNRSLCGMNEKELSSLCGYIPQRSGISMKMTAVDVVLMGFNPYLRLFDGYTKEMHEKASDALEKVGLGNKTECDYTEMSEGQKQLCIFARAIAAEHKMLILDEPDSALDINHREKIMSLLNEWKRIGDRSVFIALHDPTSALNSCDRLIILDKGKIKGSIQPFITPKNEAEAILSQIYGDVSLHMIKDRSGQNRLIMLKENDI